MPDSADWFDAVLDQDLVFIRQNVKEFAGTRNLDGKTALIIAVEHDWVEIVKFLVDYEASYPTEDGLSPLALAAGRLNDRVCVALLAHEVFKPISPLPVTHGSPLVEAIRAGRHRNLELLSHFYGSRTVLPGERTPLHEALTMEDFGAVCTLLRSPNTTSADADAALRLVENPTYGNAELRELIESNPGPTFKGNCTYCELYRRRMAALEAYAHRDDGEPGRVTGFEMSQVRTQGNDGMRPDPGPTSTQVAATGAVPIPMTASLTLEASSSDDAKLDNVLLNPGSRSSSHQLARRPIPRPGNNLTLSLVGLTYSGMNLSTAQGPAGRNINMSLPVLPRHPTGIGKRGPLAQGLTKENLRRMTVAAQNLAKYFDRLPGQDSELETLRNENRVLSARMAGLLEYGLDPSEPDLLKMHVTQAQALLDSLLAHNQQTEDLRRENETLRALLNGAQERLREEAGRYRELLAYARGGKKGELPISLIREPPEFDEPSDGDLVEGPRQQRVEEQTTIKGYKQTVSGLNEEIRDLNKRLKQKTKEVARLEKELQKAGGTTGS